MAACSAQKPKEAGDLNQSETNQEQKNIDFPSDYLTDIVETAKKGMTDTSPFNVLSNTIEQVEMQWEEPVRTDHVGNGFYATYDKKNTVFGFTAKGEIYDIRSYKKQLQVFSLSDLKEVIGEPAEIRTGEGEKIIVYNLSKEIQLKFIILNETDKVDHLSVYNEERGEQAGYVLDLKGNSDQLTNKQWQAMQTWRSDIVNFKENQPNLYINGRNEKKISLTFDDGPDEIVTPKIIEILQNHHVKGNFFFIGSEAEKYPQVVKNAYENGNLVLSHSYHHVDLTTLSNAEQANEINNAGLAIQTIIGKEPAMIRPPYGETNETLIENAKDKGYSVIIWSIDTLDWSQKDPENIIKNVTDNLRNGDIILMHSDSEKTETAKALPTIIEAVQEKGFEIVGLDELLGVEAYQ
ncbi:MULTISPECIES: polysaccharide deacetylase family protein [unclassified Bacillus (in: firmicutes)]|uniref:polysaccharide deacetylase family protein n=1 Tax=unclassified Bacillus (in: firmicutes) TaxID=185979 RepID=UPI000A78FA0F|nr:MULTISPECIES: polysaccharide deacetylase family protein [unclassified Bacillus (in: firmicutes)]